MSNIITRTENGRQFRIVGETEPAVSNICKKVIEGNVFIVPNLAMSESNYMGHKYYDPWVEEKIADASEIIDMRTHDLTQDRFIQIWTCSPESENWSDHGHPQIHGHFPDRIPAKWLEGLTEGDVLVLVGKNQRYFLVCNQTSYRYQRFGTFEEVLDRVNKDYVPKA